MPSYTRPEPIKSTPFDGVLHPVHARNEARILIEVNVASDTGVLLAGQRFVQTRKRLADGTFAYDPDGRDKYLIYASELAEVMGKVATEEHKATWARAEKTHARQLAEWLRRKFHGGPPPTQDMIDRESARYPSDKSVAAVFCQDFPTGCPPIRHFAKVKDAPPPETPENHRQNDMRTLGEVIAQAVREGREAPAEKRAKA